MSATQTESPETENSIFSLISAVCGNSEKTLERAKWLDENLTDDERDEVIRELKFNFDAIQLAKKIVCNQYGIATQ
jgi:hypothetical protein